MATIRSVVATIRPGSIAGPVKTGPDGHAGMRSTCMDRLSKIRRESNDMRTTTILFLAALPLAGNAIAHGKLPIRYLELVNRAHDSVVSLSVATAGSQEFRELPMGAPVGGGGQAATFSVAGEDCRYDIRASFSDGRAQVYRDLDLCRHRGLRIPPLRMSADRKQVEGP